MNVARQTVFLLVSTDACGHTHKKPHTAVRNFRRTMKDFLFLLGTSQCSVPRSKLCRSQSVSLKILNPFFVTNILRSHVSQT